MDPLPVSLPGWRRAAAQAVPTSAWDYLETGSGDEHTLRANREGWARLRLAPRVLVDVAHVDTSLTLLGTPLAHPVLVAPVAAQRQWHPDAEVATLAGAAAAGALTVVSTLASTGVEEVGQSAAGPWWFQVYLQHDRAFSHALLQRAVDAGAVAAVLTVDTPMLGARDRDRRLAGHTVDALEPPNLHGLRLPAAASTHWSARTHNRHLDPAMSWADLDRLRAACPVPLLVKGVLRPDDARRAVAAGVDGVIVSNHGGRNLDTVPTTAEALPRVVEAVGGGVPVLVDGGLRRGTDVAKAVALGASAVLVGRPTVYGLAVTGADGVAAVIDQLRAELCMAMAQLGTPRLSDLGPDALWPD